MGFLFWDPIKAEGRQGRRTRPTNIATHTIHTHTDGHTHMTQDKKSHNHERDHACYSDQFYRMRGFYACMRKMLMHVSVDISLTALH
jgi:hypothetical protein